MEAVKLLLQRKANPTATNQKGQTVLDLAKDNQEVMTGMDVGSQKEEGGAGAKHCERPRP